MYTKFVRTSLLIAVCAFTSVIAWAQDTELPPSADTAETSLNESPRHQEFVDIAVPELDTTIQAFLAFPERSDNAPVVLVIHEIFGMTDWVNSVADQLAEEGFIAIAPNLIHDKLGDENAMTKVRRLERDEVNKKLDATLQHALALPAANGTSASIGWCWGGSSSFAYAVHNPDLDAAVVYYGSSPPTEQLESIRAAVQGHYGEDDARVNATIPDAREEMERLGKTYEVNIYDGAGHGFLRAQDGREGANLAATEEAWPATLAFLRKHTGDSQQTD